MATATWIKSMLRESGVAFEEMEHREAFTAQEVAQSEHVSGHRMAKVVVVMVDGRPVEVVIPASRRIVTHELQKLLGARDLRLASEIEMDRIFQDVDTGAIPALRHWEDVDVIMDAAMKVDGDIVFQAGTHRDTVRMAFLDWFNLVRPKVGSFTELENSSGQRSFTDREDQNF